jgi:Rrf2 family nitric oxide-sensitive transcriptional repressor
LTALDRVSLADLVGSDARLHEALGLQAAARAIAPITIVRPPAGRERR